MASSSDTGNGGGTAENSPTKDLFSFIGAQAPTDSFPSLDSKHGRPATLEADCSANEIPPTPIPAPPTACYSKSAAAQAKLASGDCFDPDKVPPNVSRAVLKQFQDFLGNRIRAIAIGGAAVPVGLVPFLRKCFPGVRVEEGYGTTEVSVHVYQQTHLHLTSKPPLRCRPDLYPQARTLSVPWTSNWWMCQRWATSRRTTPLGEKCVSELPK